MTKEINFRLTKVLATCGTARQFPPADPMRPEIVLAGKSNVGKSTLINALTGSKRLAYTSQTPGKTRLIIFFEIDETLRLVDVPGYGYAKVSPDVQEKYSGLTNDYLAGDRPLAHILLLLDARHKPGTHDWQLMDWLQTLGHPWSVVLTKSDKLSRQKLLEQKRLIKKLIAARFSLDEDAIIVAGVSAARGSGIPELRQFLASLINARAKKTD
ncbi:MAG: ribosome biogenesis GTP-binding protein YihA/YsxC [Saccharofermentanales bacterium]|jgi:GTP-binding protein|nr:ribosome biogenesis GTP-binding protein YihA/YsxC [Bacillota bacterium]NLB09078.1 ribosome biogenesis GTP-binding protein YsxC [Clostridiales bacterium]